MSIPTISICIPTYNRSRCLDNCLNSIAVATKGYEGFFEVCVSDNGSDDDTAKVISNPDLQLEINYHRNSQNLGIPRNFIQVVSMARGEFVWLIGDDDLLLPDTLQRLLSLLESNSDVDFFYLNSFHLLSSYVESKPHPFDITTLPDNMEPFSKRKESGELNFLELIDPDVSFDFLGGMFLSAFRRSMWDNMVHTLDPEAIQSDQTFSHFDNTFPHLKVWANAFANSTAYFNAAPMIVCITGHREWAPLEPLVRNIRLVEALEIYRENGLPLWQYVRCKNFALRNYFSGLVNMMLHRNLYAFEIHLFKHYLGCAFYPNVYLSFFYVCGRKFKSLIYNFLGKANEYD